MIKISPSILSADFAYLARDIQMCIRDSKYIVLLQILDTKKEQDMDVATRVSVQLQMTDPDLKSRDRKLSGQSGAALPPRRRRRPPLFR